FAIYRRVIPDERVYDNAWNQPHRIDRNPPIDPVALQLHPGATHPELCAKSRPLSLVTLGKLSPGHGQEFAGFLRIAEEDHAVGVLGAGHDDQPAGMFIWNTSRVTG